MKLQHLTLGSGSTLGAGEAVISDAVQAGELLFLSGRAPVDPVTLELVAEGFEEQAQAVLHDVGEVLEAAGATWDDVVRVQCFLARAGDFASWNRIWSERFVSPRPARTTVVTGFAVPGMLIELEVVAAVRGRDE